MLLTMILSACPNKYLKINLLIGFLDQPEGDELDLIIIFFLNILHSIMQYKFAWKEKTVKSFPEIINLRSSKRLIMYLNFLDGQTLFQWDTPQSSTVH